MTRAEARFRFVDKTLNQETICVSCNLRYRQHNIKYIKNIVMCQDGKTAFSIGEDYTTINNFIVSLLSIAEKKLTEEI